jgi:proteasome lid subunit RPN8/RPN11
MRVNIKITSPTGFHFDDHLDSEVNGTLDRPIELEKKLTGYVEDAALVTLDAPVQLSGKIGRRLLLHVEGRDHVHRIFKGESDWATVFFVPDGVMQERSGSFMDSNLIEVGRGMTVSLAPAPLPQHSIRFTQVLLDVMMQQSEIAFPEECGGLLLGTVQSGVLQVKEVVPLANMKSESRHNRIEISPLDYAKAERLAAQRGIGVWGFYHSHPNAEAVPSDFDKAHFPFTNWWYPILSVKQNSKPEMRCWKLLESRERFMELIVEVSTAPQAVLQ